MKWFAILFAVLATTVNANEHCFGKVTEACSPKSKGSTLLKDAPCTALFSGFMGDSSHLQTYANDQIAKSYDFLLLSANFGNYVKNRPGFQKEFRALSDKAWNDGIDLIKKITQRGGQHNFTQYKLQQEQDTLSLNEVQAMAYALDVEKKLAKEAHNIHHTYSFNHIIPNTHPYDPEITFYLEEHFLEKQAEIIRKLSGYTNDLKDLISAEQDKSLALYLYDEYLQSA